MNGGDGGSEIHRDKTAFARSHPKVIHANLWGVSAHRYNKELEHYRTT